MQRRKKKILSFIISVNITILLFLFLFKKSDIGRIKESIFNININYLIFYIIFSVSNAIFRAYRYKLLILPIKIKWHSIIGLTFVRNIFVDMFPAKVGALSYVVLLNQKYKIPIDTCLSSFFYSFLFDILTLPPYLILSYYIIVEAGELKFSFLLLLLALCLMGLTLALIFYLDRVISIIMSKLVKFKYFKIDKFYFIFNKMEELAKALKAVKELGYLKRILFISLLMRGFKYLGLYSLFYAVYLKSGLIQLKQLSYLIFGITAADFTALLPIQGIAGFGTWETAWALAFKFFGVPKEESAYVGLLIHLYAQSWEYTIGFIAFCLIILPYRKMISGS